jgi:hypothetical protein
LSVKIDGLRGAVYTLLNGLYCQHTQMESLNEHLELIGLEHSVETDYRDTHPSGIWPTTRQGDRNRKRIEQLENTLKTILEFDANCFAYEQVETKSDTSSVSSNHSEERIKNSFDLCGNA